METRTDYRPLIYGALIFLLLAIVWQAVLTVEPPVFRYGILAVLGLIAVSCHFYIFKKGGGYIPYKGKPTIHSRIILGTVIAGIVIVTAFAIALRLMF